jgi:hypothetical protein
MKHFDVPPLIFHFSHIMKHLGCTSSDIALSLCYKSQWRGLITAQKGMDLALFGAPLGASSSEVYDLAHILSWL